MSFAGGFGLMLHGGLVREKIERVNGCLFRGMRMFIQLAAWNECTVLPVRREWHLKGRRLIAMKVQVRITRTDTGSNTRIKSEPKSSEMKDAFALETAVKLETKEACKDYGSWDEALSEAERLGLISRTEAKAAKVMPPGMPYNTSTEA